MQNVSEAINVFFSEFEKNSNTGDVDRIAAQFSDPFMVADPSGSRVVCATDFRAAIPKRKKLFESLGCRTTTLESIHETRLNDGYVLAKTEWRMQFDRGAGALEDVTAWSTFVVHTSGETPKIVFYLTHENHLSMLQKRGILRQEGTTVA
jgi:ketosteroid isomerase-like protein